MAIVDFLDDLREHIWARYGLRIQDFQAEHDVTQANHAQRDLFDPGDPIVLAAVKSRGKMAN